MTAKRFTTMTLFSVLAVVALALASLTLAITLGGPAPINALDSVNAPFKNLDYSALPPVQRFSARDGAQLAYRRYATSAASAVRADGATANAASPANRRVILVHGSSASSRSMHPLAMALQTAGFDVAAVDMRGHGDSGPRGHIAYIGQLEDDIVDFSRNLPHTGPQTLLGFSAGAGFVLRFSASAEAALFDRYLLLAPFLIQAPTNRPGGGGWASVGLPRIVALSVLNRFGVTRWNDLPVTQFALNAEAAKILTPSYSYALATNFGAHLDYKGDIAKAPATLKLLVGADDELMVPERYAEVFAAAGKTIVFTQIPGANHIGLTVNPAAIQVIVAAAKS